MEIQAGGSSPRLRQPKVAVPYTRSMMANGTDPHAKLLIKRIPEIWSYKRDERNNPGSRSLQQCLKLLPLIPSPLQIRVISSLSNICVHSSIISTTYACHLQSYTFDRFCHFIIYTICPVHVVDVVRRTFGGQIENKGCTNFSSRGYEMGGCRLSKFCGLYEVMLHDSYILRCKMENERSRFGFAGCSPILPMFSQKPLVVYIPNHQ
ncbi:hypothetical protein RB195_014929 [Necator americanus]|uniref:Uncharacterized protein n=1 Tax=Necator americanus TaxID=51031 RepID=A0ABR1E2C9_NECAM